MSMPSIIRSSGTFAPAALSSVGYQSTTCTISLLTFPAGTFPGQRMMQGVRFDPSREVNRPPRHGPEDPFHVPPTGSGSIVWVW